MKNLLDIDQQSGFRSAVSLVPRRYFVSEEVISSVKERGFELCVHGLYHDGRLFSSHRRFLKRAAEINTILAQWGAAGFTAPSMHRNLDWMHALNIDHSTATFDTDPFEPQPDGVGTIFPFTVNGGPTDKPFVELPYTLPQDFTLFVLMREKNIHIWQRKLDWVAANGGMALFNTHPDYMNFEGRRCGPEEYPVRHYTAFLDYIKKKYAGAYWQALPAEVAAFWRKLERERLE